MRGKRCRIGTVSIILFFGLDVDLRIGMGSCIWRYVLFLVELDGC